MVSGYTEQGAKTIIPSHATVKLDFRLVPNMMPKKQFELLKKHVEKQGMKNIDIKLIHGEPAARIPYNHPFVNLVNECAKEIFSIRTCGMDIGLNDNTSPTILYNDNQG